MLGQYSGEVKNFILAAHGASAWPPNDLRKIQKIHKLHEIGFVSQELEAAIATAKVTASGRRAPQQPSLDVMQELRVDLSCRRLAPRLPVASRPKLWSAQRHGSCSSQKSHFCIHNKRVTGFLIGSRRSQTRIPA